MPLKKGLILNVNEEILDQETMFSRVRVYKSMDLFDILVNINSTICCQHSKDIYRPYFFLFLIASIIPVLNIHNGKNQYIELISAFEQLHM